MPRFGQDGMLVLNVAEKNDAAKSLANIMSSGRFNRKEGYSKFNKIYEFDYRLFEHNCKMIMTSVSGHLIDLDFSGGYKNWNQCQPNVLFEAPIERFIPERFENIKKTLQREIRKCQALIIWTDGDREGENIGFEVIEVCKEAKASVRVYRAKFSEITPRAVTLACQNLVSPDENISNAVEVRRELDLRIGAAFTRLQTLRLTKRFPNVLSKKLISYGSCQFPTLGFVVERYNQVENFIVEVFYKVKVTHTKQQCVTEFSWKRGRVFNREVCLMFCNLCQENPTAKVTKVASKPKSKWRPLPLDTVEMEKLASRKLKINAKETMKIAEKLYTRGIISYPRTETNIFPKGMDLVQLVENQTTDARWGAFASSILNNGGPNPRQGKKTDNAHPPIHPTKCSNDLQGNEQKIYELIVRHFLACLSQDAQGQETIVDICISNEQFSGQGLMILARNYLDVYTYEQWNGKEISNYQNGETFQPDRIEMLESETKAPSLLREADLISLMEKYGIGTDATHAEHIETIKNRDYVGVQPDGTFLPGQLGMGLVKGYDSMGFAMSKPNLRAALEADLKCICEGRKRSFVVLAEQINSYRNVFLEAASQVEKLDEALSMYFGLPEHLEENDAIANISQQIQKCAKCNTNDMFLRKTKEQRWLLGCMGYPNCRNSIFFPSFVLNVSKTESFCSLCKPRVFCKLNIEFKPGSVPPQLPNTYSGCVGGCDEMLNEILNLNRKDALPHRNATQTVRDNTRRKGSNSTNARGQPAPNNRGTSGQDGEDDGDNVIVCSCVVPALKLTTKKGPNAGRQFYKCGQSNKQCNFFLWATGTEVKTSSGGISRCNCNQEAIKRTVSKDGANKGRQFYCCKKGRDQQCGFFQWVDGE
ncbi:DNA topoisomerase 3-alpha-like [Hydractinia symbiolongicarpus]|uniref:DNA topoisomerase 3-alpha-like n=1 Tax=Hydractinia symbiolongicarpus TaxID=13093 RepID=UPI00255154AD|nr:DNA topoisomerase 3-alpha-like [Hydractinia symbiolongicarpus]